MPQSHAFRDDPETPPARSPCRARLDAHRYHDPGFMQREWERMWTRTWLFAGPEADLAEPGDFLLYTIGRESIVVARTEDGGLAAHYNVCQHRGNRVLATEFGSVRAFACPYHGWTYGLDGRLLEVPDRDRFPGGVPCAERSLKPVRCATWDGLVFVNMDPQAPPLEHYLGPIPRELGPYRLGDMVLARHQTVTLEANWKTVRDNFLEQYHVDFIHPQHATFVDCCNSHNDLYPYGHSRTSVQGYVTNPRYPVPEAVPELLAAGLRALGIDPEDYHGRVPEIRGAVQRRKRQVGPRLGFDYAGFTDEQVSDVYQYDVFPNLFLTVKPEEVWVYGPRPHPTDPDRCFFDKWTLQIPLDQAADPVEGLALGVDSSLGQPEQGERPEHEWLTRDDILAGRGSLTITIDQDIGYLPEMQAGMHSRGFDHALLNDDEVRVQHFHDWLDAWLADPATAAPDDERGEDAKV